MAISAQDVKNLREVTGAGMMDCKKALTETEGDFDKAVEYLQIKGLAKAAKKADRVAAEGLVGSAISADGLRGVLVEVNSETDFVSRNADFIAFVDQIAQIALESGATDAESLLQVDVKGQTLDQVRQARIATIGENITIRRVARFDLPKGAVVDYVHNGSIGVIVALDADADVSNNEVVRTLGRDLAMHVAAMNPTYATEDEVSADDVETQTRIETEKAMESGKPREIAEKMVVGRIAKWKKEICLASQPFVKNGDLTVEQEVERAAKEAGVALKLISFKRLARGEGIEKEEVDYAAEVAAAMKG